MEFLLSTDLQEFGGVLRKFFAEKIKPELLRSRVSGDKSKWTADDQKLWQELIDIGAVTAGMPESAGGLGLGALASHLVLEESGRSLCPLPLFEVLAFLPWLFTERGESIPSAEAIVSALCEGKERITGSLSSNAAGVKVGKDGALTGSCDFVPSLSSTGYFLTVADGKNGKCSIYSAQTSGVTSASVSTFDLLREYSTATLKNAPATLIRKNVDQDVIGYRTAICTVAELAGIAQRVVEMTVEYVKTREQFGRPIGSFQAIQHKLADMHLRAEQVQSLGRFAAWCIDSDPSQLPQAALAAKGIAGEYVPLIIEQSIQAHGGIGFTFEYDLHLYLRRALVLSKLMLSPDECYSELGQLFVDS